MYSERNFGFTHWAASLLGLLLAACQPETVDTSGFTLRFTPEELQVTLQDTLPLRWQVLQAEVLSAPSTLSIPQGNDRLKYPLGRLLQVDSLSRTARFFQIRMPGIYQPAGTLISAEDFYAHFRPGPRPLQLQGLSDTTELLQLSLQTQADGPRYSTRDSAQTGTAEIEVYAFGNDQLTGLPSAKVRLRFSALFFSPADTLRVAGVAVLSFRLAAN